jgi:crossover junction endodeoxyribonuclease RuvC
VLVLGVDPGTLVTGWGLVTCGAGGAVRHVDHGIIRTNAAAPLWDRLKVIHDALLAVAERHRPAALSLEQCFVSKNVQSALKLGHTRGVVMLAGLAVGAEIHEYTPMQIKSAVTGSGRADKHQVAEMVRVILGLSSAAPYDASDALAAALCHGAGAGVRARVPARAR